MNRTLTDYELFELGSPDHRRLHLEEQLIFDVTEGLSEALESAGLTKTELAKRLGTTKGFVSQLLAGGRNLTLRTVADVADALGCSVRFSFARRMDLASQPAWRSQHPIAWAAPAPTVRLVTTNRGMRVDVTLPCKRIAA
jgi:plasmid maintenance system antidote protein VapI